MATITKELKDAKSVQANLKAQVENLKKSIPQTQLPDAMQAKSDREQGFLTLINAERKRNGLPAFNSYAQANAEENSRNKGMLKFEGMTFTRPPQAQLTNVMDVPGYTVINASVLPPDNVDPLNDFKNVTDPLQAKLAGGEVYNITSGLYYVAWNRSRAYIQSYHPTCDGAVYILVHSTTLYGKDVIAQISNPSGENIRDLTRSEFDDIVKSSPSWPALFRVYSLFRNLYNVQLNIKNAKPVW